MSAFKGTPGPWFANHHSRGSCEVKITRPVGSPGMGPVAYALMDLAGAMTDERIEEMKANARLIAASPRMYDYIAVKARAGDKEAQEIISGVDHAQG